MKTGYTQKAGYNLIASAKRDDQRFISVALGAPSASIRENESAKLLNFGFGKYTDHVLYTKGSVIDLNDTQIPDAPKDAQLSINAGKKNHCKNNSKSICFTYHTKSHP